ncbi:MAG: hypothetical protein ABIN36_00540 [Ferruginibacter sp.]
MLKTDKTTKIFLFTAIAVYIAVFIIGIGDGTLKYISIINAITSGSVPLYWVNKQLRITQHIFELREAIVLSAETLFTTTAVYTIFSNPTNSFLHVLQYLIYGMHFIVLLLFAIYLLTCKINRLI